jgi:D-alanine-D-alanine ligase-like ATP-grasp enzyme
MTEYVVPANLDKVVAGRAQAAALFAHRCLGCYGFSRVDMILKDDLPFILEVNTIPGLTRMSLLPKAASDIGISFSQLCIKLVELAYQRAKTKKGLKTNFFKNYEGQKNKISV